jgi:hypothetical protein
MVLAYNRSQDRITRFSDATGVPSTQNIITGAGRYLSTDYNENTGRLVTGVYSGQTGKLHIRSVATA